MPNKYEQSFGPVTHAWNLIETLSDSDFKAFPERWNYAPGMVWSIRSMISEQSFIRVGLHGKCKLRWVCNRSGGTLLQGTSVSWYREFNTAATSGTVSTITSLAGSFVENENVWDILHIRDDAGGAGAAPESEWGLITKAELNTAETHITFTVQTDEADQEFTVAPAAGDTFDIISNCQVIPCSAADPRGVYAGVVLNPDGIADNYWGWIAEEAEMVSALIEAGTAITANRGLRVANGADGATIALSRLEPAAAGSLVAGQCVAYSIVPCSADVVSDLIPVRLLGAGLDEA